MPEDPDPQLLIAEDLRDDWIVVPRDTLTNVFIAAALVGAGAALSIAGLILGNRWLWIAFPVALVIAQAIRHFVPWSDDRLLRELRERSPEHSPETTEPGRDDAAPTS